MKFELDEFGVSRTVLACAGMGATMGMLLAGTIFGVAPAVTAAIIGALGAGILGHFVERRDSSAPLSVSSDAETARIAGRCRVRRTDANDTQGIAVSSCRNSGRRDSAKDGRNTGSIFRDGSDQACSIRNSRKRR